jgi:hypothetical protein
MGTSAKVSTLPISKRKATEFRTLRYRLASCDLAVSINREVMMTNLYTHRGNIAKGIYEKGKKAVVSDQWLVMSGEANWPAAN